MDIRQLRAFVALAECGSYREAAQQLCITQPALTKQIQSLEKDLGATLFARGRHGAKMTHFAAELFERTRLLIRQHHEYRQYAVSLAKGTRGSLAVGFGISAIRLAPGWVAAFRQRCPDVSISLEDMPSRLQTVGLLNGQLQLAFTRLPVEPPLTAQLVLRETLVLAVPRGTGIANRLKDEGYDVLATLPLLMLTPDRGPGLDSQIAHLLRFHQITPHVVQHAGDIQTLIALVSAGAGVAMVPHSATWFAGPDIELISLCGPYTDWDIGLAWNPSMDDPLRDLFIQMIDELSLPALAPGLQNKSG